MTTVYEVTAEDIWTIFDEIRVETGAVYGVVKYLDRGPTEGLTVEIETLDGNLYGFRVLTVEAYAQMLKELLSQSYFQTGNNHAKVLN